MVKSWTIAASAQLITVMDYNPLNKISIHTDKNKPVNFKNWRKEKVLLQVGQSLNTEEIMEFENQQQMEYYVLGAVLSAGVTTRLKNTHRNLIMEMVR